MSAPTTAVHDRATVADLLRCASHGDQQAWAELIARYTGIVTGVVAGFRLQESDAADAVAISERDRRISASASRRAVVASHPPSFSGSRIDVEYVMSRTHVFCTASAASDSCNRNPATTPVTIPV